LGVVVMPITIAFRYVLENNPPVAFDINSSCDLRISSCRGTEITFRTNPVSGVIGRLTFRGPSVIRKVDRFFL